MPPKATFPQNWFTEEAGPSSGARTTASPSFRRHDASTARASSSKAVPEETADDGNADLDLTEELTRKNSFEAVLEAAKRAESVSMGQPEPPTKPLATAQHSTHEGDTYVQRRALPPPTATKRPASDELIELSNLPSFTRSSRWSLDGPSTPPAAHLPRR